MKQKTESKHTPGTWYCCCDSGYSTPCLRGVQHSKKAAIHSDAGERPTIASHIKNWEDARLIAAAPDLLAALRDTWALLALNGAVAGSATIRRIEAAIRKAEGRP